MFIHHFLALRELPKNCIWAKDSIKYGNDTLHNCIASPTGIIFDREVNVEISLYRWEDKYIFVYNKSGLSYGGFDFKNFSSDEDTYSRSIITVKALNENAKKAHFMEIQPRVLRSTPHDYFRYDNFTYVNGFSSELELSGMDKIYIVAKKGDTIKFNEGKSIDQIEMIWISPESHKENRIIIQSGKTFRFLSTGIYSIGKIYSNDLTDNFNNELIVKLKTTLKNSIFISQQQMGFGVITKANNKQEKKAHSFFLYLFTFIFAFIIAFIAAFIYLLDAFCEVCKESLFKKRY